MISRCFAWRGADPGLIPPAAQRRADRSFWRAVAIVGPFLRASICRRVERLPIPDKALGWLCRVRKLHREVRIDQETHRATLSGHKGRTERRVPRRSRTADDDARSKQWQLDALPS